VPAGLVVTRPGLEDLQIKQEVHRLALPAWYGEIPRGSNPAADNIRTTDRAGGAGLSSHVLNESDAARSTPIPLFESGRDTTNAKYLEAYHAKRWTRSVIASPR
jgi:hypothetical protein